MHLPIITNSSARTFRRCHRLYRHRYVDCMRSTAPAAHPLRFGTLIHRALEAWWRTPNVVTDGLQAIADVLREAAPDVDPFDLATADALLGGYHYRWAREPLATVAVEREFHAALVDPESGAVSPTFSIGGKADAVAQDAHGNHWLVEHKTTSEDLALGSLYWKRLQLDPQVSLYLDALSAELGVELDGCLYDVIRKPAIKPLKATPEDRRKFRKDGTIYRGQRDADETPAEFHARLGEDIAARPDFYYARGEIARTARDLEDARVDLWQTAEAIQESERLQRWPRNPDACFTWSRVCEYFGVCTGVESLSDPQKFEKTAQHTELSERIAHASPTNDNANEHRAHAAPDDTGRDHARKD